MLRKSILILSSAMAAAAAVPGCGDDSGLARRYPVSGTVTYNGKPLEQGNINFVPDGPGGRAAGGTISAGRYTLTTQTPEDGALPGKYKVSVISTLSDRSSVNLNLGKRGGGSPSEVQKKQIEAAYPQLIAGRAAAKAKRLIPATYNSAETSGLTFEVQARSNTADFPLKD